MLFMSTKLVIFMKVFKKIDMKLEMLAVSDLIEIWMVFCINSLNLSAKIDSSIIVIQTLSLYQGRYSMTTSTVSAH